MKKHASPVMVMRRPKKIYGQEVSCIIIKVRASSEIQKQPLTMQPSAIVKNQSGPIVNRGRPFLSGQKHLMLPM